jgi:hypothetical protein
LSCVSSFPCCSRCLQGIHGSLHSAKWSQQQNLARCISKALLKRICTHILYNYMWEMVKDTVRIQTSAVGSI